MGELSMCSRRLVLVLSLVGLAACAGGTEREVTGTESGGGEVSGIWIRETGDGSGDRTDLAIGTVRGEAANRVWACEVRPRRPSIVLQRGTLTGDRIVWDAVHGGVPDYRVSRSGDRLRVEVQFPGAQPTTYSRGSWSSLCPALEDTRIFVLFTMTGGPGARLTSATSTLPCAGSPIVGQRYGGCPRGPFRYSLQASNGLSATDVGGWLDSPAASMRRIYSIGFHYNNVLNRYLVGANFEDVSNVGGRIAIRDGNGQVAERGATLPTVPSVRVTTPQGAPVVGATVHFRIVEGDGTLATEFGPTRLFAVLTDSNGVASTGRWTIGIVPGPNRLTASALDMVDSPVAFTATGTEDRLVRVAGGRMFTCALSAASRLLCWGSSLHRPLMADLYRPSEADGPLVLATVSAGRDHACGLRRGGQALCWGVNDVGQLGRATPGNSGWPDTVATALRFSSIVAGGQHSCALDSDGRAWCWGNNTAGQLGDGTTVRRPTPVAVSGGRTFVELSLGSFHSCGITAAGAAFCWGRNAPDFSMSNGGALGDGTIVNRTVPTLVSGGFNFAHIAAGAFATCGIERGGATRCWGDNQDSRLGTTSTAGAVLAPTLVRGNTTFTRLAMGEGHACGITAGGALQCWGDNVFGQVGIGTSGAVVSTPTAVTGSFVQVATGSFHTCAAISGDAQVLCWGLNDWRQLGVNAPGSFAVPTPITTERAVQPPVP